MLFNSIEFLVFFLPITFLIFLTLKKFQFDRGALLFIAIASLFFYGWWDIRYLSLLISSVIFNFVIGLALSKRERAKTLLIFGIAGNLLCLGFFKYFNFFIDNVNLLTTNEFDVIKIILPLGISFFTFQQISYLVDAYKKEAQEKYFISYLVFVTFFPQLIAGPIVHHKNMMPQFNTHHLQSYDWNKAAIGLTIFAIGLFKKVVLADSFASHSTPIFSAANAGQDISLIEGWVAALGYTLQLYFDFSGYSDMAIGLALLFGIVLPLNFFSPYKSTNIIDFWRKWHITLSTFLKDYLYIPLGGNKKGKTLRYVNLMITMLLGGLWHGAGWTFVFWGALHGLYLIINNAWRALFPLVKKPNIARSIFGWLVTMLAVVVAWVIFRSENMNTATQILSAMFGKNAFMPNTENLQESALHALPYIGIGLAIILLLPNSFQVIDHTLNNKDKKRYSFTLNKKWVVFTAFTLMCSLYLIIYKSNRISEFIYFQF